LVSRNFWKNINLDSLETFFGEENNENKMEIVEKNVHIHNVLKQHMDFDEEYEDEGNFFWHF